MKTLTIENYQKLAKRTCPDLGSLEKNLLHMRLGIITEVGEVLDIFKKNLAYGKPIDIVNLGEELADVAWYACNEATFRNREISLKEFISSFKYNNELEVIDVLLNFNVFSENCNSIMFMVKSIAEFYNLNIEECLYKNIEKLKIRYPDKFDTDLALNRNLDAERKVLEGDK